MAGAADDDAVALMANLSISGTTLEEEGGGGAGPPG
eukprot:CAMPEP_0182566412 /NCGR_PEP_ID=MMETSP1324-20130603/7891_1 /TAXON_ID=236786 /ORGANISM="Florenciella sp., Strain RCC1587" /LENGTH=35 /DNA_ID= /DNA_START= /DNA_END= /DNA_ORIENTATION=